MTLLQHDSSGFSGSYMAGDVTFLLRRMLIAPTGTAEKERLIQTGQKHYSEMISEESPPSLAYQKIFWAAFDQGRDRLGRDIAALARAIFRKVEGPITLASLVRAGIPPGILLKRALAELGADVEHFGISIIRDKGLDAAAIGHILETRPVNGLVFVDGWTGKGAIAAELERDFMRLFARPARLVVVADLCGSAWLAASGDDWLIPSGILGSTISGLISRSILNAETAAAGGFHGCIEWDYLAAHDFSREFITKAWTDVLRHLHIADQALWTGDDRLRQRDRAAAAVSWVAARHAVTDDNRIKPGIAEATRAILRRIPERIFVTSRNDPDLAALVFLAERAGVPFEIVPEKIFPYRAVTLIAKVK